ncbi:hypothetical protein [Undibacterium umbellatum]|uniref:DUF4149 domain-containing protein n=1 Tax=Undibacterium umbellatum TaxID=2762300 RepID=A0ABR6Z8E7_9BURK|nr:hypothetical protein [Undibacterium umbellatum]MBC3907943.1 hypothetical protein [Undibacterium umbellatum]
MQQIIGTITSLIIGFFAWGFTLLFSKGSNSLGSFGWIDAFVFFTPIVCLIVPAATRRFKDNSPAQGMFLLAIAPIIGILNYIPLFFCVFLMTKIFGNSPNNDYYSVLLCQLVWACVLWVNLKVADNGPKLEDRPLSNQEQHKAKNYSGILQIIGLAYACLVAYFLLKL